MDKQEIKDYLDKLFDGKHCGMEISNWRAEKDVVLKGRYLLTDPCYVVPDDQWTEFCDNLFKLEGQEDSVCFDINGRTCVVFSTAFGDGSYPVYQLGVKIGECGVDAGLISFLSVTKEEIRQNKEDVMDIESLGVFVEVDGLFEMREPGNVHVGDLSVITDYEEEETEDQEDDEND